MNWLLREVLLDFQQSVSRLGVGNFQKEKEKNKKTPDGHYAQETLITISTSPVPSPCDCDTLESKFMGGTFVWNMQMTQMRAQMTYKVQIVLRCVTPTHTQSNQYKVNIFVNKFFKAN